MTVKQKPQFPPVSYTVWQDVWLAISQPRHYLKWAFQPFWRSVRFLLIISFVMAIVGTLYFYINLRPLLVDFGNKIAESVPMLTFKDNLLSVEDDKTFVLTDSSDVFFKVDTTQLLEDKPMIDNFYKIGFLIIADGILIKNGNDKRTITYSEFGLGDFQFNGQTIDYWLDRFVSSLAIVVVPCFVFLYLVVAKLLYSLIFSFLVYLITGFRHDFLQVWNLAIYAITPAILVGYFTFLFYPMLGLYTLVYVIYLSLAVNHYRRFMLNR